MGFSVKQVSDGVVNIKLVKGDSFEYPIKIYTEYKLRYIPGPADAIFFRVYNKFTDITPLYEKKINYNDLMLIISADESELMRYGSYVYAVKIEYESGFKDTVISGTLTITSPGGEK